MFKQILKEKLKGKIKSELLELLPRGFQLIGDIAIINLKPELRRYKKQIGKAVKEILPYVKTVCNKKGKIKGQFRQPQIEIIEGKETETIHKEHSCLYKLDVKKIMFAKGNVNERTRIAKKVRPGETIIDMFAGIGYFTIPIAKLSKAKKIYAIEINPVAFHYLLENLKLNKVSNVEAIKGDCKEIIKKLKSKVKADRIIMGLLPPPKNYLESAFSIIKKQGIVHYETLINTKEKEKDLASQLKEIKEIAKKQKLKVKLKEARKVKDYAPHIDHYVFDLLIY